MRATIKLWKTHRVSKICLIHSDVRIFDFFKIIGFPRYIPWKKTIKTIGHEDFGGKSQNEKHKITNRPKCQSNTIFMFFPEGGRPSTKNHKNWRSGINCLMRFQRMPSRLKGQGWIKRSLTFVGVLGSPRNSCWQSTKKIWIFHLCHIFFRLLGLSGFLRYDF